MKLKFNDAENAWLHRYINLWLNMLTHKLKTPDDWTAKMMRLTSKMRSKFTPNQPLVYLTVSERELIKKIIEYRKKFTINVDECAVLDSLLTKLETKNDANKS